jgi:phosphatidyl-myo-inositol dimannoside synthase
MQNVCRDQVQALIRAHLASKIRIQVLNDAPQDVHSKEWQCVVARGHRGHKVAFSIAAIVEAMKQRPGMLMLGHRSFLPLAPCLKAISPRTQICLMIHGMDAWPRLTLMERACLLAVDRVFSVSPDTASRFKQAGCRQVINDLPNGLPHYWKLPGPEPPPITPVTRLLSVARLCAAERLKGIDHTIEALAHLRRCGLDLQYDVVGTGDDLERLVHVATSLGVLDYVRFHGSIPDEKLATLYQAADIFVLPSGSEGFGLVFLEAMAYGKPVVAADVGGAPFVVRPKVNGCLVPYGSPAALGVCLEGLIKDPQASRQLGQNGRKLLEENFTFECYQRRFLKALGLFPLGQIGTGEGK